MSKLVFELTLQVHFACRSKSSRHHELVRQLAVGTSRDHITKCWEAHAHQILTMTPMAVSCLLILAQMTLQNDTRKLPIPSERLVAN